MEIFVLPQSTKVQKVIPKNAFETYTNAKQKRLFTSLVSRITWAHKLSTETINLPSKEIREIQIFKVELKLKEDIKQVLAIIDKAIPYNIIFIVEHEENFYLSTSIKHPHPANENNSVIDWTFKTEWFPLAENKYTLPLKKSLDSVYQDFCIQISPVLGNAKKSLTELVEYNKQTGILEKEIISLKSAISNCMQFNQKVELNLKLKAKEHELTKLKSA